MTPVQAAQEVVSSGQAVKVGGVLLDYFTASAIVTVAAAVSPANLARMEAMSLPTVAAVCMKIAAGGAR